MEAPRDDRNLVPALPEFRTAPPAARVLCFAPHPDDEVIGPGGALRLHRLQGDAVRVIVATDGVAGDPDGRFSRSDYGERRRGESRRGLRVLDIEDLHFWGLRDSCVITEGDLDGVAARVSSAIAEFGPGLVYLPWEGESHSDHRALYSGVLRGMRRASYRGLAWGYEVWNAMLPDVLLDITDVAEAKRSAILCYETQLAYADYIHPIFGLNAHRSLLFRHGRGYCEGFRIVTLHPPPAVS